MHLRSPLPEKFVSEKEPSVQLSSNSQKEYFQDFSFELDAQPNQPAYFEVGRPPKPPKHMKPLGFHQLELRWRLG
ncbi:hypothetical protein Bca52824_019412 [Brassica carinata]|uniref:Uncharacterized protein n=1 Tax=Brassica carinata TaxID=52824 RepID=A0A8X7VSX6_BRACI|nr:hypothetical protein Bca52824_019412 [Brassica carinata]